MALKRVGVVGFAQRGAQDDERILAADEVGVEVEAEGAADGALGEARNEGAVLRA